MIPGSAEQVYGALPKDWKYATIGDLVDDGCAELQTGPFGTMLHAGSYRQDGTPVVAVQHIGDNRLRHDDLPRVGKEDRERLQRYTLQAGDILFGRKGAVERRAIVTASEAGWLQGSDCIRVRFNGAVADPCYVSHVLGSQAHRAWITRNAQGATMASLNQEIVSRIPLPLAPLFQQRAIASVLGALDDKIEVNRRMNETLESMARAIFKSWFVDFDPVRTKAEGRQPVGMNAEVAALFPASQPGEAGPIPTGWTLSPLDEIAVFLNGLAMQKFPPKDGNTLPVIKIAELHRGNTDSSDIAGAYVPPEYHIEDGDLLFSWSGSLEVCIWAGGCGALNQHLFKVTSATYPRWFIYHWITHHLPEFQAIAAGKATTMGHIQRHHLHEASVVVPPNAVMEAVDRLMSPLFREDLLLRIESRTLGTLRDALLPKLLSGEIRIRDAERTVEDHI